MSLYTIRHLMLQLANNKDESTFYINQEMQLKCLELYIDLNTSVIDNHIILIQLRDLLIRLSKNTNSSTSISLTTLSGPLCSLLDLFIDNDWIDVDATHFNLLEEQTEVQSTMTQSDTFMLLMLDVVIPVLLHFFSDATYLNSIDIESDTTITRYLYQLIYAFPVL
ncbi:hypothetical protein [Paenibacillus sp. FSL H3-0333]|uniref:hypothetical protein n=1 Tax=Paenibacillus sp. FSL H3-0333 TaxID=2921373 RepID=UPI0030FA5357